jgi:hypothetical protein
MDRLGIGPKRAQVGTQRAAPAPAHGGLCCHVRHRPFAKPSRAASALSLHRDRANVARFHFGRVRWANVAVESRVKVAVQTLSFSATFETTVFF